MTGKDLLPAPAWAAGGLKGFTGSPRKLAVQPPSEKAALPSKTIRRAAPFAPFLSLRIFFPLRCRMASISPADIVGAPRRM
jgi:hypothetical protein